MAADMKGPGQLRDPICGEQKTVLLLPPSEFEKPVARDIDRAGHIDTFQFRQHGQGLMKRNTAPSCVRSKAEYLEDLIEGQAAEIVYLKSELTNKRAAYEREAAEWMTRLTLQEEQHAADLRRLETQLASAKEDNRVMVSKLSCELEQAVTDRQTQTAALKLELESTRSQLETHVHDLEQQLASLQQDNDDSRRQLESELRQKTVIVDKQAAEISQLKSYLSETQETQKPALAWRMEKEAADNKLQLVQAENCKLTSTRELLEVRFQALKDILFIQEQELDKVAGTGAGKPKQATCLLTRWREKVFSLLLQLQTTDIQHKKTISDLRQQIQTLQDDLSSSQVKVQVLQHSLTDKAAQLQIEVDQCQRQQEETALIQHNATCLSDQCQRDCHSVELLSEFVHRTKKEMDTIMKVMQEKSACLQIFGHRLSFVTKRLDFVHTQQVRRSALSDSVSKDPGKPASVSPDDGGGDTQVDYSYKEAFLCQELDRLCQERDSLSAQIREDTKHWSQTLADIRRQCAQEVTTLTQKIDNLQHQLQNQLQECKDLSCEVDDLKENVKEKNERIQQLQTELARHERGIQSVLADQQLADEVRWSDQIADLQRKLNSAKREHTKAVVSLRQMEQSHQRRLQQEKELFQTTEQHLTRQIEKLSTRLSSVEKEKNLMMATLRQEGLLDQLKSNRRQPHHFTDEEENCSINTNGEKKQVNVVKTSDGRGVSMTRPVVEPTVQPESVQLVLEDLRSVLAAVLQHDDDEEEEEEEGRQETTNDLEQQQTEDS